jgi:hypothetical protein
MSVANHPCEGSRRIREGAIFSGDRAHRRRGHAEQPSGGLPGVIDTTANAFHRLIQDAKSLPLRGIVETNGAPHERLDSSEGGVN